MQGERERERERERGREREREREEKLGLILCILFHLDAINGPISHFAASQKDELHGNTFKQRLNFLFGKHMHVYVFSIVFFKIF